MPEKREQMVLMLPETLDRSMRMTLVMVNTSIRPYSVNGYGAHVAGQKSNGIPGLLLGFLQYATLINLWTV